MYKRDKIYTNEKNKIKIIIIHTDSGLQKITLENISEVPHNHMVVQEVIKK